MGFVLLQRFGPAYRFIFPLLLLFLIPLKACSGSGPHKPLKILNMGTYQIKVEIAQSPEERRVGLMGRKNLPEDQGMLFVFEHEQKMAFWMKDTPLPLSIAYISKAGEIKEIHDLEPFSEKTVHSRHSVLYALEVNRGYFKKRNIKAGDFLDLPALRP